MIGAPRALGLLAGGAAFLSACAAPLPEAEVRHVAGTKFYEDGRFHLFLYEPREERSFDERLRLAQRQVERERACRWIDAPRGLLEEETRRQEGELYVDTLLAAPLRCG